MSRQSTRPSATVANTQSRPRTSRPAGADGAASSAPSFGGSTMSATSARKPTADEIRRRAYELYLARRGVGGSPEQDWLQAERELSNGR